MRSVTVATFVLRFATGLTGALLIYLLADFGDHGGVEVGPLTVGLMTALFFAAELVLSPPFGVLSDRLGYRRIMQLGPLFGLLAVLLTAAAAEVRLPGAIVVALPLLAGSLPLIGLTRVLEGAATAASVPSVLGFIARVTSGDEALRGRASARFEAATIAGLAVGFAAAGPLWTLMGPSGFLANAVIYALALGLFRYRVPALPAEGEAAAGTSRGWTRYGRLLRLSRVWLLAPTWIALNAVLGLYTSQTLFQLVRTPDRRFAEQALVGGFEPLLITAGLLAGGLAFFGGLLFWGGRFASLRRTTIILYGIAGGVVFVAAALLLNHSTDAPLASRLLAAAGLLAGLFLMAGATPAALGLLADVSESFPADRGAIMGLYSVFLAVGQVLGALVGAVTAELLALDGILVASLLLQAVAVLPISRLRRFESRLRPLPAGGPPAGRTMGEVPVGRAYDIDPADGA